MQTSAQVPHRKQNCIFLVARQRCQPLMHCATKGNDFFFFGGSHFVPTQVASVAAHPLGIFRGRSNTTADLTRNKANPTC